MKLFNFGFNPREKDKNESLSRLAKNMGCSIDTVKASYLSTLRSQEIAASDYKSMMSVLENKKAEEGRFFRIHPDDTAVAFMEQWTREFFENEEYKNKAKSEAEINAEILTENDELRDLILSGGSAKDFEEYLGQNPDLLDSLVQKIVQNEKLKGSKDDDDDDLVF